MTRVDNVPFLYRPFFLLFGWGLGVLQYLFVNMVHYTCTIRFEGTDLKAHNNYILCIWHESLVSFFTVFTNMEKQAWMNHPAWYMKPVHVLLRLAGVKHLCLGSTGNSGKEALEGVIVFLKTGYSTTIACDGPAGPPHLVKPGVLLMSLHTGAPVIPLRFKCSRFGRLRGWDQKVIPRLFSEIIVQAGEPIFVTTENYDESTAAITQWLNG